MSDMFERLKSALQDRYAVESELGQGGMATVFLARDLKHNRQVAIKVLLPDLGEALGSDRFLREIETAASLSHPHILTVHDSGEADGLLFYVMPFVEGESLRDRIDREKQLPIDDVLQITQEVADALAYAHSQGVIHRDIKPENVLMHGGHAVIADFGIARAVSDAGADRLTGTGVAVGTPTYMSPEQAAGEDVDSRSDTYALGCLVYEMLVGEPPFTGATVSAVVQQHIAAAPPEASIARLTVNKGMSDTIIKSLAKAPADRYASPLDFIAALKQAMTTGESPVMPTMGVPVAPQAPPSWTSGIKIVGGYALAGAAAFLLLDYLVNRFVLSPHLPMFGVVALLTLLPTVAIVAYQKSRGPWAWTRLAKIGIPINIVLSVIVLGLTFGTKDLGAATRSVLVEDEEGNSVERVVPKSEFRKRIVLFFFDAEDADSTTDWLQYGIPLAIDADLMQDMFFQTTTAEEFADDLKEADYTDGVGLPLTLQRELAEQGHAPHFLAGTIARNGDELTVTTTLYETKRGRALAEQAFTGTDVFALVDEMTVQLKHDLGVPTQYIEDTEDLPIAETMTTSVLAYEYLMRGYKVLTLEDDWQGAATWLRRSLDEDPTNAYAHTIMYVVSVLGNDQASASASIQGAMQHLYRLPERMQFDVKAGYYDFSQQPDKVIAVMRMRIELFPEDIEARAQLAGLHVLRNERDKAIQQFQTILEIDPTQYEHLQQLGSLSQSKGDFDEAVSYYERYAEQFPDDRASYTTLGGLYRTMGEHERAKEYYERALLIEPENTSTLVSLARLERSFGNMEAELEQLQQALDKSKTPQERAAVLGALKGAYGWRGQLATSIEYMDREFAERQAFTPQALLLITSLSTLDAYIEAGRPEEAERVYTEVAAQLEPPFNMMLPLGRMVIAVNLEDPDAAEAAIPGVEQFIQAFGVEVLRPAVIVAQARIAEQRGAYAEALQHYETQLAFDPSDVGVKRAMGRCHGQLGDFDKARELLQESRRVIPNDPWALYELGVVEAAAGDEAAAREHLEAALAVWRDADPDFEKAREAREKLAELAG